MFPVGRRVLCGPGAALAAAAGLREGRVGDDAGQPRRKCRSPREAADASEGVEVGALHRIFCVVAIPQNPPCGSKQALIVTSHDQAKCRSEEHTSELQSLMRISYAVFCLKKKINTLHTHR